MRNWYVYSIFKTHISRVQCKRILALATGAILFLLYLPGHPPYYELAVSIAAKTYSNAMLAGLNGRFRAVCNAGTFGPPMWNESENEFVSIFSPDKGISFHRDTETNPELLATY